MEALVTWFIPQKMKNSPWPLIIGLGYILLIFILGGLRSDHIVLGLFSLLYYYNERSRLFLKYFLPFVLTGVVYDFMRYFYWQAISHEYINVKEPYYRDLSWFGINITSGNTSVRLTPNEFFQTHHWPSVDLLCGFAYLTFIFEYLGLGFYLFFKKKWILLFNYGWCFFSVNVIGYLCYFIYPAAPPWYVTKYGLGAGRLDVRPESGAAIRFDQILGTHFFDQMYGRGVDVFGAYPSLHVAYPLLVCWIVFMLLDLKWARIPAVLFYFLMCFSAVYLQHHYVVDILLGSSLATAIAMITTYVFARNAMLDTRGD